jgi:hypothetical protein
VGKNDHPKCELESLAKDIFIKHTECMDFNDFDEMCGCEWWVQVKEIYDNEDSDENRDNNNCNDSDNDDNNNDNNNDDKNNDYNKKNHDDDNDHNNDNNNYQSDAAEAINHKKMSSIGLHYDKDEVIAEIFQVGIFPQISTVTYLSPFKSIPTVRPPFSTTLCHDDDV